MNLNLTDFSLQRNERREREQRELVKKLREENENFSDLMYDDCRSCSESTSSSGSCPEVRNKWHSAEDIRNRKACILNCDDINRIVKCLISGTSTSRKRAKE